jgi:2-C-methyl-D-erythritol 4-phosphate cytidylyltransferase
MSVWAVIAAAGSGERLGADRPKAFARLGDLPLLAESVSRLDASDWVEGIVVAAPPGWEEPAILLAEEVGAGKVSSCVTGGASRADSVRAALAEVPHEAAVIVVHDAARPLLTEAVLERALLALNEGWDGAVPGLPVSDTVKRVENGAIVETLAREDLYAIQTPQAFSADVLRDALSGSEEAGDCSALVEAKGYRVRLVEGDPQLLKITSPADLELVETWL